MSLTDDSIRRTLDELCAVFDAELERQQNILAVCRVLGDAARAHDVEYLEAKTAALEVLIRDTAGAEAERHRLLRHIVDYYELSPKQQTLTRLAATVPQPWRRRMEEFQRAIQTTLLETGKVVRENAGVIRRSIKVVGQLLNVFQQAAVQPGQYDAQGAEPPRREHRPALMDQKG